MSSCQVFRNNAGQINRVEAPNGKESKLYKDMLSIEPNPEAALRLWAQVYTPSFKKWFGNWEKKEGSKVVDDNGEPLLVYHNSMQNNMEEFKGYVSYFTDNKEYAKSFKGFVISSETQYPAFLNITNPYSAPSRIADVPYEVHITDEYTAPRIVKRENPKYNGVIGIDAGQTEGKTYVAFEPNQIKSAFNQGTFSEKTGNIYQQTDEILMSEASTETLSRVKEAAKRMGINIQSLANYAKDAKLDTTSISGVADLVRGIIAIADGKESVALTEEMVHIATAILEQTNPKLVTEMMSKIDKFKIYKQTFEAYKNNKAYQLPNGKPDIRKIKKEAVDKLIAEIIVNKGENSDQNPELREEATELQARSWWNTILDWIRGLYKKSNISLFEDVAAQIITGEVGLIDTSEITLGNPTFNPDNPEANSYPIRINGNYAGVISVNDEGYISSSIGMAGVELEKEFQGKGFGTKVYLALAKELAKQGKTLKSEALGKTDINEVANRVWQSLIEKGYAKDRGEYYELDPNYILGGGVFYQLSDKQSEIVKALDETKNNIDKVVEKTDQDPLLLDSEEANNYYKMKKPDGTFERVAKRVTDRVKAWYKSKFGTKQFTAEEKKFNELKRDIGIQGHKDFEDIHDRYFHKDGTKKTNPDPRPTKFDNLSEDLYDKIEKYYVELVNSFPAGTIIKSEVIVYDKKNKEAGTIDFLAIEPSGKAHILDWKFMHIAGDDVAWFKQGAFNIQLGTYKNMLRENYGIKEFGMTRAIPIPMKFVLKDINNPNSGYRLGGITIGSVDPTKIEDIRLIPISEETESTGFEALDKIIKKLNGLLAQIGTEEVKDEQSRQFKIERLNTLRKAIRQAQGSLNIAPLVDVIEVMRKEGDRLLNDYNTIYKDRPARSDDSQNDELSDFSDDMNNYIKLSDIFTNIGRQIGDLVYNADMEKSAKTEEEKENVALRKETFNKLRNESDAIYDSREEMMKAAMSFADKHIGQRNLVTGLTKPEKVLKGLASLFRGAADLPLRSLQILTKLTGAAQSNASASSLEEVTSLMKIREKLSARGGDLRRLIQQIYQKDDKGKLVNKLIHKYSREFHDTVDAKANKGGDIEWLKDNIDVDAYRKEAGELLAKRIDKIQKNRYPGTAKEEQEQKDKYIDQAKKELDIDYEGFIGWNNYIIKRHPLAKWYSQEYKAVMADPELLELYNFVVNFNQKANEVGYIQNQVSKTFLPFIRKSMAEQMVWDNKLSVMDNMYKSLQMNPDDVGYGEYNKVTGELENSIPKYYTYDFTQTDSGVNDYSQVSEDLFKNLILYIQHVNKYKYMTEVEGQLKLVKTIEEFKNHLRTNRIGNVVIGDDGKPQEIEGNVDNTKMYDDFLRVLLYDQKYVLSDSDLPLNVDKVLNFFKKGVNKIAGKEVWKESDGTNATSLMKTIDAANRGFQLKTLGFEFISGAVNMFGGNIQIATQAGNYFKAREFAANEAKLTTQKFANEEDKEMFIQLVNTFMPLKDDPSYEMYNKAGMSKLTRGNLSDILMVFMRQPEILIEKSIFLSLLQNTMVEDGKLVSIREFVKNKYKDRYNSASTYNSVKDKINSEIEELKKTRAISVTKKLENGNLVIPGLDLNNREELQRLTNLSRRLASNATGAMTKENINRMSMSVWTKSMMVFKNWIPKLADTRFGEFRKVSDDFSVRINEKGIAEGEKYDIGRIRLLLSVLGDGILAGPANLKNMLYLNDAGLERLDQMFEEFREKYERETGETLNMTREDFIDLIRTNLRNQIKELMILASLLGMALSLGFIAPDDDEDKAAKNFHRYSQKVVDKFVSELSFFYNPAEMEHTLSGGMFPAVGIAADFSRFFKHFAMETTGMDFKSDTTPEDVREKAQPIKYAMKMAPVTKSLVTYLSIFSSDFAKEFDVTIQKESNR